MEKIEGIEKQKDNIKNFKEVKDALKKTLQSGSIIGFERLIQ